MHFMYDIAVMRDSVVGNPIKLFPSLEHVP